MLPPILLTIFLPVLGNENPFAPLSSLSLASSPPSSSSLPHPAVSSHPSPPPQLSICPTPTVTETRNFQNMQHMTHKSRWIRTTGQKYGNALRYFIHRTYSVVVTTYRRFFEADSAYFSICKHNTICCWNTSLQPPSDITDGGALPWETSSVLKTNGDHLEKYKVTTKPTITTSISSASGTKMQMYLLPSPCGLVQF